MATKTLKLKNNSARPIILFDGTLLTPGQVTEVNADTVKKMKEGTLGKDGPTIYDSLLESHDIEVVKSLDDGDTAEVDLTPGVGVGGGSAGSPDRGTGKGAPPRQDLTPKDKEQKR